jgi:hypothetical protein
MIDVGDRSAIELMKMIREGLPLCIWYKPWTWKWHIAYFKLVRAELLLVMHAYEIEIKE